MKFRSGRINWNFLAVFGLGAAALVITIGGLWFWNKHLRAQRGLRLGLQAYENKQWNRAADYLGQYLAAILPQQDIEVLLKYAEAQLNQRPVKRNNVEQALRAYHQILQIEENDQAQRSLIELYLRSDPGEAERIAREYLERKFDSQIACYAARALMERNQFSKAFEQLRELIQKEPSCINAYLLLAQGAEQNPDLSDKKPLEWLSLAVELNPNDPLAYLYRARYAVRNHQPESAAADIERAEAMNLDTRELKLQMVSVYLLAGRLQKARLLLQSMQAENANDLLLWNLWVQWALQNGSNEEMVRIAEEGLSAIQPDPYDFIGMAVELFIQAGQWTQAQTGIQRLIDRQERKEFISYLEGLLAQARGEWPRAVAAWRKIAASSENNTSVRIKLAQALAQMGDRIAAIQQLRTLLLQHPDQGTVHSMLARWCAEEGQWAEALDHARQALHRQPEDHFLRKLLIEIKMQQALATNSPLVDEEWKQVWQPLQKSQPDNPALCFLQIQADLRSGRFQEAERRLNQIEQQDGDGLQIRLLRADLFLARHQPNEAGRILDETIQAYPESLEPIQKRLVLYIQNKEFESGLQLLDRAREQVASVKKQKTLRLWKAEISVLTGREESAVQELTALAQEDPQDIAVRRRLLDLTRKKESLPRLQQWIQEIRSLEGEQGRQWRYEQARFLFERGDLSREYPQIISILEGILRDYPEDQASRILLASGHQAAGNLRLAIKEYQDALARDPENLDLVVAAVAAMYQAEEYHEAETILEFVSRRGLRDPRLSRLEAQQLLRQGKLGSASEILKEMMTQNPEDQNIKLSLALICLYRDQLDEAEQQIEELHKASPDSLPVIAARVELALRKNDPAQAIEICDQAVEQFKNLHIYTLRAVTRAKIGDLEQAEEDLWRMLELANHSKESLLLAADLFLYLGKPGQAVQIMERAVTRLPDDFFILKKAAMIFARDPLKRQTAGQILEKTLAIQPNDPDLRLLKAQFLLRENTAASAESSETMINRLLFEYPRIESAWVTLADWYYRIGQAGRAMDHVLRGLGFFPDSRDLLLLKAQIEGMRSGNLAVLTLQNLHQRFPKDDPITAILAESCLQAGQGDQALAILRQRIESDSDNAPVLIRQILMTILYEMGRLQEAKRIFEELDQQGQDPSGTLGRWARLLIRDKQWQALADLFRKKGTESSDLLPVIADFCLQIGMEEDSSGREAAYECLSDLITSHPDNPYLYLSLGRLYHYWRQYKSAEQTYRKILTLEVPMEDLVRVIVMNNLAWIFSHEYQNYEEALRLADNGLAIDPENADLLDTRGEIYFEIGKYSKAREDLEKSLALYSLNSPGRVGTGFRLAKTLVKLGKNTDATEMFERVEQWNQRYQVLSPDQLLELQTNINN